MQCVTIHGKDMCHIIQFNCLLLVIRLIILYLFNFFNYWLKLVDGFATRGHRPPTGAAGGGVCNVNMSC